MVQISRWQTILVALVVFLGILFALPNAFNRDEPSPLPGFMPQNPVNLGLDLRGGAYFLINVDTTDVGKNYLTSLEVDGRRELRGRRIAIKKPRVDGQSLFFAPRDPADLQTAFEAVRTLANDVEVRQVSGDQIEIRLPDEVLADRISGVVDQSVEVIRRRVDGSGLVEASIQRQQASRVLLQVPGLKDTREISDIINQTAKLAFRFVDGNGTAISPEPGSDLMEEEGTGLTYSVKREEIITGDMLVDSQPSFQDSQPVVSFRFDGVGARRFGEATANNVGRLFAVVLDDKVISAPVIQQPILGGQGIISGQFTTASANRLAILLRAGALPAPLTILEERSVGPGMGADAIQAGATASILGLVLVLVFMFLMYGLFGLFANVALVANLFILLGFLSVLGATLTLPGIAGIVLTIGMAVDANVLVFERIREEFKKAKRTVKAIEVGYRSAMGTIFDANITTLIAATILFMFGTGPVRGFAITLGIGIITSMFTALMLTRVLITFWLRGREKVPLAMAGSKGDLLVSDDAVEE